jgi:hypothetical protein
MGRSTLGRPRSRWKDNIEMDLSEVRWGHRLDRYGSGYRQMAGSYECGNELLGSIKCRDFLD